MAFSLSCDCNVVLAFKAVTVSLLYKMGLSISRTSTMDHK